MGRYATSYGQRCSSSALSRRGKCRARAGHSHSNAMHTMHCILSAWHHAVAMDTRLVICLRNYLANCSIIWLAVGTVEPTVPVFNDRSDILHSSTIGKHTPLFSFSRTTCLYLQPSAGTLAPLSASQLNQHKNKRSYLRSNGQLMIARSNKFRATRVPILVYIITSGLLALHLSTVDHSFISYLPCTNQRCVSLR